MSLVALSFRLAATQVILREGAAVAHFTAAHSNDPADPNKSYALFTPHAEFDFTVTNPEAFGFIKPGVVYDLVLVPRDSVVAINLTGPQSAENSQADAPVDAPQSEAGVEPAPQSDTPTIDAAAAAIVADAPATPPASDEAAAAAPVAEAAPVAADSATDTSAPAVETPPSETAQA